MPDNDALDPAEEIRVGVYTCQCGGNIGDVVRCPVVARALGRLDDVAVSRTDLSLCSDAGQAMIEEDIRTRGINRVVIGACAPALHEKTFRGTVARAGLNPYFYHHVGIREQDSWVHHDDRDGATAKALRLLSAGIAKARLLDALEPYRLPARRHALVIGGGVSGLSAALHIARCGLQVTLIERAPFLGGRVAQLGTVFPSGEPARDLLRRLIDQVVAHPNIAIYTQAELTGSSGYVGDFQVQIRQQSRGVDTSNAAAAMAACTDEVPDPLNYGLTRRKVIYKAYPGCYPTDPVVDWDNYVPGSIVVDGQPLTLENHPRTFALQVGAVVVATGFKPYEPQDGEYGYGLFPEVVTLPAFIRLLAQHAAGDALLMEQPPCAQHRSHPLRGQPPDRGRQRATGRRPAQRLLLACLLYGDPARGQ